MDHLNRYFCEAGVADKVYRDHKGLIRRIDASGLSFYDHESSLIVPRQWDHYSTYRSIVLLGPPRQGKTIEFKYQCSQSTNGFFLPLRDLSDPTDPEFCIDDQDRWKKWLHGGEKGELFIDALD